MPSWSMGGGTFTTGLPSHNFTGHNYITGAAIAGTFTTGLSSNAMPRAALVSMVRSAM